MVEQQSCPCGTGETYAQCCGPALSGQWPAETAEALMRSRYTAFVLADDAYLYNTWHWRTRPADASAPSDVEWRRLRIRDTQDGGPADKTGTVEFIAHFRTANGSRDFLHERAEFVRDNGRWVYVSGAIF